MKESASPRQSKNLHVGIREDNSSTIEKSSSLVPPTGTPSEASSTTTTYDDQDYFIKFNKLAGWQTILLMQFLVQMQIVIFFSVYAAYATAIIEFAFAYPGKVGAIVAYTSAQEVLNRVLYTCDVMYALDCLSMYIFKKVKWNEVKHRYKPRSNVILTVELVSLIPLESFYSIMVTPVLLVCASLKLRYALRLVRLHSYVTAVKDYVGKNTYLLHICMYVMFQSLFVITATCFVYMHLCNKHMDCIEPNYTFFFAILYETATVFTFVGVSKYVANIINSIFFSSVGFLTKTIFTGFFVCSIMRRIWGKCIFMKRCIRRQKTVNAWKKNYVKEWTNYHKKYELVMKERTATVYERTQGNNSSEYLGKFLPPIMYKELYLDICLVPLKHSHLFRNEDIWFLRQISLILVQKFICPGEIIYKRDEYKSFMIYIVSGTIDILSEEDGESPIMSLTSGSCIGESSLVIGYPTGSTVVSKDACDIVMLNRNDLARMGRLFPEKMKRIAGDVKRRYTEARVLQMVSEYQFKSARYEERTGVLAMKWLKHTLRSLLFNVRKMGDLLNRRYLRKLEKNVFCMKYLDLLAPAADEDVVTDAIFLRAEFPFVFRPNSILIQLWNGIIMVLLAYALLSFPWFMIYYPTNNLFYMISFAIVTIFWLCDIYLRCSTAIKSKYFSYNTVSNIVVYNLSSFTFTLDIIAAIPVEIIIYFITGKLSQTASIYTSTNRLIKVYKLEQLFDTVKVDTRTLVYLTFIRFCVYLFLLLYYLTATFYLIGHSSANYNQFIVFAKHFGDPHIPQQILVSLWGVMEFYCTLNFVGFPFTEDYISFCILTFIQIIVSIFNIAFIAYLSAVVTIDMMDEHQVDEFNRNLIITIRSYKLMPSLQKRIWRYVELQRQHFGDYFFVMDQVFDNIPLELAVISRGIQLSEFLKSQPLFQHLDDWMIAQIAYRSSFLIIPEQEVIRQVGEMCPEIYVLMNGICRVANHKKQYKTVYETETFNVLEACFEMKSLVTIRTETPCLMIALTTSNLRAVLLKNIIDYQHLMNAVETFPFYSKLKLKTTTMKKDHTEYKEVRREYRYFGYALKKRTRRYNIFREGFTKRSWIFQYVLMHIVFSNQGAIVYYWEIARITFALISAFIVPIVHFHGKEEISNYMFILDCTAYVDIYFRHHVSYYDHKGIEIMHPMKTAIYYWKHALALDLLASMPIEFLLSILLGAERIRPAAFKYTRYLQLYRFKYFMDSVFKLKFRLRRFVFLKYIPYIMILINSLSMFYLMTVCTSTRNEFYCNEESSIIRLFMGGPDAPEKFKNITITDLYCWAIYTTTTALTYTNHYIIHISLNVEIAFFVVAGIIGTIGINICLAKMIESNLSFNRDLSVFQEALQRLTIFLSFRKIDKQLKSELVNHFEFLWRRTKGKDIHKTLAFFKRSFKVDALYNIYGSLFWRSTIFPNPNESFFRSLFLEMTHEMYLKKAYIYRVNDINGEIYILLKGVVDVVGADGNKLTTLSVGSVFGNLDDCRLGRRTLSIVCGTRVDVLKFKSHVFHQQLKNFKELRDHFYKLTLFDTDYLMETSSSSIDVLRLDSVGSSLHKKLNSQESFQARIFPRNTTVRVWESFVCYVAYFSFYVEIYHLTTMADSYLIYILLYGIDVIFLIKIYMMFHTSYDDEYGKSVRDFRMIARRYMKKPFGFIFDVCTTIPFDLLTFIVPMNHPHRRLIYPLLRFNRFPRVILGLRELKQLTEKLNVIIIIVRLCHLLACVCLVVCVLAALVMFSSYEYSDTMSLRFQHFITSVEYILCACSYKAKELPPFFEITAVFTSGMSIIALLAKVIYMVFITECCSILMVVNHIRSNYENFMIFIKWYLQNENISTPLAERVLDYTNLLWAYHKGVHFPPLLEQAPYYLREAVLNSMFGYHLDKHPVLKHLHKDLARQMTARMKTIVFFPGDIVAYVGDIDSCMYFIDEGEVSAICEDTMYSEVVDHVLIEGDVFGLKQGILYNLGHQFTYKVAMYTVLVVLKRDDWIWLLDFFPASKFMISEAINTKLHRLQEL